MKQDERFSSREDSDFRVEWFSGTGGGGQHRNKHQNSCRLTHVPTGIVETSQCRSRENSLKEAKSRMAERLDRMASEQVSSVVAKNRKTQVGSGMRGDKMRTYRFQDNIVTDDRTGKSAPCDRVMKGNFQLLW